MRVSTLQRAECGGYSGQRAAQCVNRARPEHSDVSDLFDMSVLMLIEDTSLPVLMEVMTKLVTKCLTISDT